MTKEGKTKKRFMNSQGKIEFTGDGRRKNIQQHAFSQKRKMIEREREKQIAGINANLYTIYSSGRLTYFFLLVYKQRNEINSTFS